MVFELQHTEIQLLPELFTSSEAKVFAYRNVRQAEDLLFMRHILEKHVPLKVGDTLLII